MRPNPHGKNNERGSIMMVVASILIALLAGGAIAVYVQVSSTRSTRFLVEARASLYCAEAGLAAARNIIGQSINEWPAILDADPSNDPGWYPITGDLDGDGVNDYEVTVRDNDDELPPDANDPNTDNDLALFISSRCIRYPESPREVFEMIKFETGGSSYRGQAGQGAGNTGNVN